MRLIQLFLLSFLFFSFSILNGQDIPDHMVNQSPYHVIYNHLYYLQPDTYDPIKAARSLYPDNPSDGQDEAIRLKEVLDGMGLFVDVNRLPEEVNYFDSTARANIYTLSRNEPRIYVEKIKGRWVYSNTTLGSLDMMYASIYPFNGSIRSAFTSPSWQVSFLGLQLWQWFSLLILIAGGIFFFGLIYWLMRRLAHRAAHLKISSADQVSGALSKLAKVISLLITFLLIHWLLPAIHLLPKLNAVLIKGMEVIQIVFIILIGIEIVHIIFSRLDKWAGRTESTMDDQLIPLLSRLSDIVIWSIGAIYILDYLEVNVTALLAGISIGGLAIALAAQDTVKNFFGSVMIFLDKPFQVGDWISFGGVDGVVERVGVRSTRIRTFANSLTYVPNGIFAEKVIDNMGLRIYRRYKTEIGITYDTPTYLIDLFVEGIENLIGNHPYTRKDNFEVALSDFADSSINILIYAFFSVDNWTDEVRGKHDIMKGIINLAEALGVRFAFPSQTIHIESMPGHPSLTPTKPTQEQAIKASKEALEAIKGQFVKIDSTIQREKNLGGE